jgi:hypothetical protein
MSQARLVLETGRLVYDHLCLRIRTVRRRDAALPRLTLKSTMTLFRGKYRIESARKPAGITRCLAGILSQFVRRGKSLISVEWRMKP